MEPKYLNVYAHSDCSGGLVHVRSGPSVNYDSLRSCAAGVETATHTSQFMEGRQYMQIRREYATDVVLDGTCVPTGLAPRLFAFVNCSAMTHALYTDANCSHLVPVVDITSPQVECSVLNDVAVSSMPLPPPALKYLKRFENADCTGVLTYVATLSGVVAIAHDTQSCVNAFELNLIPPRWKDYAHDSSYMHLTNYDSDDDHAHSLVLHGACVEFSPRKYVVVDCYAQTITHYADESCQTLDLHGNRAPLAPRWPRRDRPTNCSIPSTELDMSTVAGGGRWSFHVAVAGMTALALGTWLALRRRQRRQGFVRLLKP
ncbi:hypothetical protein AaE_007780 [Aphanomyces astaci]|uniref:Uncharacterized protein n=1 Tax=Aphanomyces astaci TaxID=112090 RepID=A0A6A5ADL0_APHAT|nr:hypothetical protein AaE_007780 [Aphanomyces astaci]